MAARKRRRSKAPRSAFGTLVVILLAALAFGICMDKLMGEMIPGFASPVGRLLGLYIAVNEAISICENLDACGIRLPKILSSALENAEDKLDARK